MRTKLKAAREAEEEVRNKEDQQMKKEDVTATPRRGDRDG